MQLLFRNTKLLWIGAAICLAGLVGGWWNRDRLQAQRLGELEADVRRCAVAFQAVEMRALSGTRADEGSAVYAAAKQRLAALRAVHPAVRFVSVFRYEPVSRRVFYLADSEPAGSKDESRPGKVFSEAATMPGLQKLLATGQAATDGPVRDASGEWVTGYALIGAGQNPEEAREIVAMEIVADDWQDGLFEASLRGAVYIWLLLGLPMGAFLLTRRHAAQTALIDKLSGAVEESESAVLIADPHGRIEYVNGGLCRQTGYSRREVTGRLWRELLSEETSGEVIAEISSRVKVKRSWSGNLTGRRKPGDLYPVRGTVSPVHGKGGRVVGFIAVLNDTTELYRHADGLRKEKERAEAGDRAKGVFLATMSHEVRTPLNGVVGFTSLLLDTTLSAEQREYVQTIRTSSEALVQLTGDIMDFSRIESGGLQLDALPCDVQGSVENVLDILAGRAAEAGIELLHAIDGEVPLHVLIDAGRLRQVLVNLVGNAIKFTRAGEVEVTVRRLTGSDMSISPFGEGLLSGAGQFVAELEDGSVMLEFAVRDTGIGIALEDRPKLFQAFSQLDSSTVRRYGGAGLGLVISRNLVRLMGGDIRLESEAGKGSTFFFTVRCRPSTDSLSLPPAASLAGRTIGVVTRRASLYRELARELELAGATVRPLPDEALEQGDWDLAVVDTGTQAKAVDDPALRPGWPTHRLIGLVDMALPNEKRQALRPHFRMLLNKPLHHRTLVEIVAKVARDPVASKEPARMSQLAAE